MATFAAYPSMSIARQEDFADTSLISEVFARHVISRDLPADISPVTCTVDSVVVGSGVRLRFTSRTEKLDRPITLTHKFFFIDREETRERLHTLTPENPEATSEVLVLFDENDRDYCHASVYDGENRLLAAHAVVFDRKGRTVPYPFTSKYVSPLKLGKAELRETTNAAGRRMLRFTVGLEELAGPERVNIAWQAMGLIDRQELICTPDRPEVYREVELEDNTELAPGDWVVIAVDEQERFLAQTLVTLQPVIGSD